MNIIPELIYTYASQFIWIGLWPLYLIIGFNYVGNFLDKSFPLSFNNAGSALSMFFILFVIVFYAAIFSSAVIFLALVGKLILKSFFSKKEAGAVRVRTHFWLKFWLITSAIFIAFGQAILNQLELASGWFISGMIFFAFFGLGLSVMGIYLLYQVGRLGIFLAQKIVVLPVWVQRFSLPLVLLAISFPIITFISAILWFVIDDNAGHGKFNTIHAAIKNTCLGDPRIRGKWIPSLKFIR